MRYYVDTCIWLEILEEGKQASKLFLVHNSLAVYSDIVLRELCIKIGAARAKYLLEPFLKINTIPEDKKLARKLESQYEFQISFYDLVHLVIAKRLGLILVTRDSKLSKVSREQNVFTLCPEEL